jgi:hypothetical protein
MRKTIQLSSIALVLAIIGLMDFTSSRKVKADDGECFTGMSEETARYVREKKIPLKGTDSEFYSNRTEQVYLLSSEETLKLDSRRNIRNTVAVINHKEAGGKGGFYVIEQEIAPGRVTYFLKKDSQVLQSLPMKLFVSRESSPRAQAIPGKCDCTELDDYARNRTATLLALANQTCHRQTECIPYCKCVGGKQSVAYNYTFFDPTSWRCRTLNASNQTAVLWNRVKAGTLLDQAFDTAIKKEAALYTF